MAAGSSPTSARRGRDHVVEQRLGRRAAPPSRFARRPALRDFTSCEATSTTTFGRASKLAPMTPTGRRHSCSSNPSGRLRTTRSAGSKAPRPGRSAGRRWPRDDRCSGAAGPSCRPPGRTPGQPPGRGRSPPAPARRPSVSRRAIARRASSIAASEAAASAGAAARAARAAVTTAVCACWLSATPASSGSVLRSERTVSSGVVRAPAVGAVRPRTTRD